MDDHGKFVAYGSEASPCPVWKLEPVDSMVCTMERQNKHYVRIGSFIQLLDHISKTGKNTMDHRQVKRNTY